MEVADREYASKLKTLECMFDGNLGNLIEDQRGFLIAAMEFGYSAGFRIATRRERFEHFIATKYEVEYNAIRRKLED